MASVLKQKTAKSLAWSGFFSLLQQLISLFFGVIIARILNPSDYGMVGMLSIFIAMATVLQESGFVFVLTNRKGVVKSEYSTVFWFNVTVSITIYLLFYFAAPLLGVYYKNSNIVPLSRYVFLGFVISSFGVIQSTILYKEMKVKEKGIATFVGGIVAGILGIILAINGFAYWGLATQSLVSTFITTILLWHYSSFRPSFLFDFRFLRSIIGDGFRFAMPNMVSVISGNIYSLVLGRYFTVQDVGHYTQANKYNSYAYSFTLGMIRNVAQPMLVQVKDNQTQLLNAFRKLVRFTALLSIPIMIGLALVAPELIVIVLTTKWIFAGHILQILCLGGSCVALSTLATYYLIAAGKSSLYMWLGIINSSIKIVLAVVASFWGVKSLAYMCASLDIAIFLFYYYIVKRSLKYTFKMVWSDLSPIIITIISVCLIVYFTTIYIENIYVLLITKISFATALFIILMNYWKYDVFEETKILMINKIKNYL